MSSSRRREESSILLLVPSTMILSCVSISFSIQDEFLRESSPQLALISPQSFNCYESHNFSALTTPIDCLEFFCRHWNCEFLAPLKARDTDWLEAANIGIIEFWESASVSNYQPFSCVHIVTHWSTLRMCCGMRDPFGSIIYVQSSQASQQTAASTPSKRKYWNIERFRNWISSRLSLGCKSFIYSI